MIIKIDKYLNNKILYDIDNLPKEEFLIYIKQFNFSKVINRWDNLYKRAIKERLQREGLSYEDFNLE
jgi:hypothetical protein